MEPFKFGRPPMRGFLIHFLVYIIVVGALAALNMIINPNHPWVLSGSHRLGHWRTILVY